MNQSNRNLENIRINRSFYVSAGDVFRMEDHARVLGTTVNAIVRNALDRELKRLDREATKAKPE